MKILILYQDTDSGATVATEALLAELKKIYQHHELVAYCQSTDQYVGAFSFLKNLIWSIYDFRRQVALHSDATIIYATIYTGVIGAKFSTSQPIVFHIHGDQSFKEKAWTIGGTLGWLYHRLIGYVVTQLQLKAIKFSLKILFVSDTAKAAFLRQYAVKIDSMKTVTIRNGVSARYFRSVSNAQKSSIRSTYKIADMYTLLFVGRIDEKKGIHHLLQAGRYLRQPIQLLIVYPSFSDNYSASYLTHLKALAEKQTFSVRFIQNPPDIAQIYRVADCVILPSHQEMMPLVMLEALASGTPFLGTKVGGMIEVLSKIHPRCLLSSTQPRRLAQSIEWCRTLSVADQNKLRLTGVKLAKEMTWTASAKQLAKVFTSLTPLSRRSRLY